MAIEAPSFLEEEDRTPAPEEVKAPDPTPEPTSEQPRGPDGKFAPKSPEPEVPRAAETTKPADPVPEPAPAPKEQPQPEQQPPAQPEPQPQPQQAGLVPLPAMLDERERRTRAEAENERLRQQIVQFQQQQQPQEPPAIPDPYEDPQGYQQFVQRSIRQEALNTRFDISEDLARGKYGDQAVDETIAWTQAKSAQSPAFYAELQSQRNPYEFAIQAKRREDAFARLGDGSKLDAFLAWEAAQAQAGAPNPAPQGQNPLAVAPAAVTPQSSAPPVPPPSLAAAPSAGGVQTQVVEDPFEAEFPKR